MAILVECPKCHAKNSLKRDTCRCGLTLKKRSGKIYWVEYYDHEGKRCRERIGPSREAAEARLAEIKKLKAEKRFIPKKFEGTLTLAEFWEKHYMPYCRRHNSPSWIRRKEEVWRLYIKPFFGQSRMRDITPAKIEAYKRMRLDGGAKGPTINRELAILKNAYSLAEKWGFVEGNPVKKVKFFEENRDRWYFMTKEEAKRFLDQCPPETRPIFEFLLATGLRLSNVLNLRWDQIDLRHRTLRIEASSTKGKRELILPLSTWTLNILKRIPRHIRSPYVFCRPDGKPYKDLYDGFKAALKRAGLPTTIRIHDLRHTFASWAIQAGVDIKTLKDLLGHATLEMVLRYAHLDLSTKLKAVDKVNLEAEESEMSLEEIAS